MLHAVSTYIEASHHRAFHFPRKRDQKIGSRSASELHVQYTLTETHTQV